MKGEIFISLIEVGRRMIASADALLMRRVTPEQLSRYRDLLAQLSSRSSDPPQSVEASPAQPALQSRPCLPEERATLPVHEAEHSGGPESLDTLRRTCQSPDGCDLQVLSSNFQTNVNVHTPLPASASDETGVKP
jgi:hypothetical protein